MYTMIRILHSYLNDEPHIKTILGTSGIFFVPLVNYDGYDAISKAYGSEQFLEMIRKNQHPYDCFGIE